MPRTLSEPEFDALKAKVLEAAPKGLKEDEFNRYVGPALAGAIGQAENSPEPLAGSALERFADGVWKNLNPMGLLDAVTSPVETAKGILGASADQGAKAVDAFKQGRLVEAAGHAAAMTPIVGPAAAAAGERIASGDVAGGLGEGMGLIGSIESPRALKVIRGGINSAATKVATSPGAQQALGATTGAVTGAAAGHPYIGMALGSKYGAPVIRSAAEGVEAMTGGRTPQPVAAPLSDLELARQQYAAGKIPKGVLDAIERAAIKRPVSPPTVDVSPAATVKALATETPQGLRLDSREYLAGQALVKGGMSPADAVKSILAQRELLKGGAFANLPTPAEVRANLDTRNMRGEIKTPSAETAQARAWSPD